MVNESIPVYDACPDFPAEFDLRFGFHSDYRADMRLENAYYAIVALMDSFHETLVLRQQAALDMNSEK
jgi:hypothetical protein